MMLHANTLWMDATVIALKEEKTVTDPIMQVRNRIRYQKKNLVPQKSDS